MTDTVVEVIIGPDVQIIEVPTVGPQGPTGDVNPDSIAAVAAAVAAAAQAETSAAESSASESAAGTHAAAAAGSATAAETQAGLAASAAQSVLSAPTDVAGTSRTLQSGDAYKTLRFTSNSAVTVTCPASLPAGFWVIAIQAGAGAVTFVAGAGATVPGDVFGRVTTAGKRAVATAAVDNNVGGTAAEWFLGGTLT